MEEVIRKYFKSWINKDIKDVFSEDIVYSECYGPKYLGIRQVIRWFEDWNTKGSVLKWDIKQITTVNKTVFVEWYFECDYEDSVGGFDGVTIAKFNDSMKIYDLREFQSKAEHYYPYENK